MSDMELHPLSGMMGTSMEKIREMVDVNTIIGDAITTPDGTVIIPVSKVSFGFAAGGSEFSSAEKKDFIKYPFGGGSGAGVTVKPVAFLIMKNENVKLLPMEYDNSFDKIIDSIPQFIESLKSLTGKNKTKSAEKEPKD
jgi:sporulation protein YtfJ